MRRLLLLFLILPLVEAEVYLFWREGCPACEAEKNFLAELNRTYPFELRSFDVQRSFDLYLKFCEAYGFEPRGVPATFIGEWGMVGFAREALEERIAHCSSQPCIDAMDKAMGRLLSREEAIEASKVLLNVSNESLIGVTLLARGFEVCWSDGKEAKCVLISKHGVEALGEWKESLAEWRVRKSLLELELVKQFFAINPEALMNVSCGAEECYAELIATRTYPVGSLKTLLRLVSTRDPEQLKLLSVKRKFYLETELFGQTFGVEIEKLTLPTVTLIFAFLDSLNPCSFFVTLLLLSLLVRTRSRQTLFAVGCFFVFVTFFTYLGLMVLLERAIQLIRISGHFVGAVLVAIAVMNIKDCFFPGRPSLGVPKRRLYASMLSLASTLRKSLLAALLLAAAIAAFVSFYEFLCTLGFPALYLHILRIVGEHFGLTSLERFIWLFYYVSIYVLPLWLIVFAVGLTLSVRRFEEKTLRLLKLFSGILMLGFAGLVFISPELLLSPILVLLIVLVAVVLTLALFPLV